MDLTDLMYEDNNQKLYIDIQEICYSEPAEPVGLEPVAIIHKSHSILCRSLF